MQVVVEVGEYMERSNGNSWVKHLDFLIFDVICMEVSLVLAYLLRNSLGTGVVLGRLYAVMAGVLLLVNLVVALFNESYRSILRRGYLKEFKAAFIHTSLVVLLSLLALYLMKSVDHYSRMIFLTMWCLYLLLTYLVRCLWKNHLLRRGKANGGKRSLLVVARESQAEAILESIQKNNFGHLKVQGVALLDGGEEFDSEESMAAGKGEAERKGFGSEENRGAGKGATEQTGTVKAQESSSGEVAGFPIVADARSVLEYIRTNWVDGVFLDYVSGNTEITRIICGCWEMGVTVHLKLVDKLFLGGSQSVESLGGYTVLTSTATSATTRQLFCKRALDILGALVGLVLTGIVTIFVGPAIMLKSPGPVFFSQQRVGKNGKLFRIYKFRSMYMDAEERKKELMAQNDCKDGRMFKMENDPRIIKGIGHFIRNTSLDELPQFWNVLKGEMSLVGTRPPTLDEWEKYELHHRKRMAIKPGITGMWQVSGRSNIKDFEEVVKLDTEYIDNWSMGLDMRILVKTVGMVLRREGAV